MSPFIAITYVTITITDVSLSHAEPPQGVTVIYARDIIHTL